MTTSRFISIAGIAIVGVQLGSCQLHSEPPDEPRRPSEWHWIQRTYPHFAHDVDAIPGALAQRKVMTQKSRKHEAAWQQVGPTNIGGRIVDIEFNPRHSDHFFVAAATGGVFSTRDGGATWTSLFDDQAVLTIGDIAVDPEQPDTLYVGTGEANGGHNNSPGAGVFRSYDGGTTWSSVGLTATASIGRVVVDPLRTNRILVGAVGSYFAPTVERGLYLSTDFGDSWQQTLFVNDSTGVIDVAVNPRSPDTVFAATWERVRRPSGSVYLYGEGSGVWRSIDGGQTWSQLQSGLPNPDLNRDATGRPRFGRIGLAISPSEPSTVYALYINGQTNAYFGLYRTDDGGDSWYDADPARGAAVAFADFSWFFGRVHVEPSDPDHVYVLDQKLATSVDGGANWSVQNGTHVDHHIVAFSPDGLTTLNGNDGGLARSLNSGLSWSRIDGLPITQFYEINYDPSSPGTFFGGTQDNGTIRSNELTGIWSTILGGDGFYVAVDPSDSTTVYAESQHGDLYRIDNSGYNYIKPAAASATNWSTPFVLHPANSSVLFYGSRQIFRSDNKGSTWSTISPTLGKNSSGRLGTVSSIAVSELNTNIIGAGTDDGNVWVSLDGGATWLDRSAGLPNRWVTRVLPSRHDESVLYVSFSGLKWRDPESHVYRTGDYGMTWESVSGNLPDSPVNALAESALSAGVLYVGSDVGAFVSDDDGANWDVLGTGLPAVAVYDLKIDTLGNKLIAGTHGRSMFVLQLDGTHTTTSEPAYALDDLTVAAFPNPFDEATTIRIDNARGDYVRATVYDLTGRRLRVLPVGRTDTGNLQLRWDGKTDSGIGVASGRYIINVVSGGSGVPVSRSVLVTRS